MRANSNTADAEEDDSSSDSSSLFDGLLQDWFLPALAATIYPDTFRNNFGGSVWRKKPRKCWNVLRLVMGVSSNTHVRFRGLGINGFSV